MLEAWTFYCEVVEEIWTSANYDASNNVLNFTLKGKENNVNVDVVTACLHIPENNCLVADTDTDIVNLLNSNGYAAERSNLCIIGRKFMRK